MYLNDTRLLVEQIRSIVRIRAVFCIVLCTLSLTAQAATESSKMIASDGASYDIFGVSVSINGDRAIVGSWRDDDNDFNSGSAYVYELDGNGNWVETKLVASDGAPDDVFGYSVSIDGDRAIVGARLDGDNGLDSGSAYMFELEPQITAPVIGGVLTDPAGTETFGWTPRLADVTEWWLYVGNSPGEVNYYNSGILSARHTVYNRWRITQRCEHNLRNSVVPRTGRQHLVLYRPDLHRLWRKTDNHRACNRFCPSRGNADLYLARQRRQCVAVLAGRGFQRRYKGLFQ